MAKLIVCNIVSLDGRYTGPGGDIMQMPFAAGFDEYNAERLRAAGTLLLGRKSYEGFKRWWPPVADDPSRPEVEREVSRLNNAIAKVVVSDSLTAADTAPWTDTTEIVPRAGAHDRVAALREAGDDEVLIFGSHVLWNDLLAAGLVDELHLLVGPGAMGDGVSAFEVASPRLKLLDARALDPGELALLRYAAA